MFNIEFQNNNLSTSLKSSFIYIYTIYIFIYKILFLEKAEKRLFNRKGRI